MAIKSTSGRIVALSPGTGEIVYDHKNQKEGEGSHIHFSAAGTELVDASWSGALTIRHATDGTILSRELSPGEMIRRVTHDRARRRWLIEHSPKVRANENWSDINYVVVREWPFPESNGRKISFGMHIESVTLSPDGGLICFFSCFGERKLHIARASDGEILASSIRFEQSGTGAELFWSDDCRYVGAVAKDKFVFFRTNDLMVVNEIQAQYPACGTFLPQSAEVALGTWKTSWISRADDALKVAGSSNFSGQSIDLSGHLSDK